MNLREKTAVVCGSTQGIGLAAAIGLAAEGATVLMVARDPAKLAALVSTLPGPAAQRHATLTADFSDPAAAAALLTGWLEKEGPAHILINNSGGPPAGPVASATPEAFLAAYHSHLLASHLLSQAVIPGMKSAQYGRIINVVSTSVRQPIKGLGVSNTTRGAVASWAKTLAGEIGAFGITVNNVLPGATRTGRLDAVIENKAKATGRSRADVEAEMLSEIPMGRFGDATEIAAAVTFLAGPSAGYITGVSLAVDGGRTSSL